MRIQIDKRLFTVYEVYSKLNHDSTTTFLNGLLKIRAELLGELYTTYLFVDSDAKLELVDCIELQLVYINKNIKIFKEALFCYETEIYEVINILGENTKIWLN